MFILEDICRQPHGIKSTVSVTTYDGEKVDTPKKDGFQYSLSDPALHQCGEEEWIPTDTPSSCPRSISTPSAHPQMDKKSEKQKNSAKSRGISFTSLSPSFRRESGLSHSYDPMTDSTLLDVSLEDCQRHLINGHRKEPTTIDQEPIDEVESPTLPDEFTFRPLLLFIPLRLGQEKFNMIYYDALKACFSLPQCVGIIGGKPRHALWFIGCHGERCQSIIIIIIIVTQTSTCYIWTLTPPKRW